MLPVVLPNNNIAMNEMDIFRTKLALRGEICSTELRIEYWYISAYITYIGVADKNLDAARRLIDDLFEVKKKTSKIERREYLSYTTIGPYLRDGIKEQEDDIDAKGELFVWSIHRSARRFLRGTTDRIFKHIVVFSADLFVDA